MKTFSEACELVVTNDPDRAKEGAPESIRTAYDAYADLHVEIQVSEEAAAIANGILELCKKKGWCSHIALAIALSHGVMIGIEMTKTDNDIHIKVE